MQEILPQITLALPKQALPAQKPLPNAAATLADLHSGGPAQNLPVQNGPAQNGPAHITPTHYINISSQFLPSLQPEEVWLEIGFGGGEHLAALAQQHAHFGFIGCEPFLNGIASLVRLINDRQLKNILILPDDARLLLDQLPDSSLDRAYLLYPDPWPKKRHIERRFLSTENLNKLARVLRPGGSLHIATDVAPLFAWMHQNASEHMAFKCSYHGNEPPAGWTQTRYEKKGLLAGRHPQYAIYQKR